MGVYLKAFQSRKNFNETRLTDKGFITRIDKKRKDSLYFINGKIYYSKDLTSLELILYNEEIYNVSPESIPHIMSTFNINLSDLLSGYQVDGNRFMIKEDGIAFFLN